MSGSWNMDECGDQMAQGIFLFKSYYLFLFVLFIFFV